MKANRVRREIEDAFESAPSPGELASDVSQSEADEGVADYFVGSTWRNHTIQQLQYHNVALFFFTDRAFRYWLPAFMLAVLDDLDAADVIPEFICARIEEDSSGVMIRGFSENERLAVISFLEWCTECLLSFSAFKSVSMIRKSLIED